MCKCSGKHEICGRYDALFILLIPWVWAIEILAWVCNLVVRVVKFAHSDGRGEKD